MLDPLCGPLWITMTWASNLTICMKACPVLHLKKIWILKVRWTLIWLQFDLSISLRSVWFEKPLLHLGWAGPSRVHPINFVGITPRVYTNHWLVRDEVVMDHAIQFHKPNEKVRIENIMDHQHILQTKHPLSLFLGTYVKHITKAYKFQRDQMLVKDNIRWLY